MLTPQTRLKHYRDSISKQTKPFMVEWGRKLTTKEREMIKANPWAMFRPRGCRIAYHATQNICA